MATGINKNGGTVAVNAHVSIIAKVVSVSGSGSLATVTCQAPLDTGTFNIQANDCNAVEQSADASHAARTYGNAYGAAGDDITVKGVVTAITGSGIYAVLTVKLAVSSTSITTAAGNVSSAAEVS